MTSNINAEEKMKTGDLCVVKDQTWKSTHGHNLTAREAGKCGLPMCPRKVKGNEIWLNTGHLLPQQRSQHFIWILKEDRTQKPDMLEATGDHEKERPIPNSVTNSNSSGQKTEWTYLRPAVQSAEAKKGQRSVVVA